jgi:hypothetical protein
MAVLVELGHDLSILRLGAPERQLELHCRILGDAAE